jgi:isopenicillin N synthase-like dioxygenase
MTILAQNKVPGLSVRLPDGTWLDAPAPEGAFLVNGGMLLRRWTNDRFLATPHRVTNRSGRERYAIPFFMDCSFRHVMETVPSCIDAEHPARYEPITYSEFMTTYQRINYSEALEAAAKEKQAVAAGQKVELQGA